MEPDDDAAAAAAAARRKAVDSYSQSLPRATEPVSAPACVLRVRDFDDDDPAAAASAQRHDPAPRCASFPQRHGRPVHGEPAHAPADSFAAWFGGGGGSAAAAAAALERALWGHGGGGALPEFVGAGGGEGIFRAPLRAAMLPGRPPALEVRPHPLRETQVGAFLRTLACDPRRGQLWAGAESGVRVWGLGEVFDGWPGDAARRRGDEESAPFRESVPAPPALCAAVDGANRLVWTGHRDGRIRAWRMDLPTAAGIGGGNAPLFNEALAWQAYSRAPVLAIVVTSYGEIWSGSEGGIIKAWPWDSIAKSLSMTSEEKHMASLLVEKAYIDLRNHATVGNICSLPAADVKYMLADHCRAKVWSVTSMSFALWYVLVNV